MRAIQEGHSEKVIEIVDCYTNSCRKDGLRVLLDMNGGWVRGFTTVVSKGILWLWVNIELRVIEIFSIILLYM